MNRSHTLLIVDGYNILNSWQLTRGRINLEAAREDLTEILSDFGGYRGMDIVLVYDAHQTDSAGMEEMLGNLTVIYTQPGETADSRIERMIQSVVKKYRQVTVATADYALQMFVLGAGALRMTPQELKMLVEQERGRMIE